MTGMRTSSSGPSGHRPILVTGVPRSGTTWLARQLALAPGTALAGREPMNPRGSQYALGGTLTGWTDLHRPTRRQRLALRTAYAGLNPLVYSRYGTRQWAAPLPTTRLVVKDPFALLSLAAIKAATGATAVVVVRHPGAVLASYRRMGWTPDLEELDPIARRVLGQDRGLAPSGDAATDMGAFWAALHDVALPQIDATGAVVLFHEDIAAGGLAAGRVLYSALGLTMSADAERRWAPERSGSTATTDASRLHNFERDPRAVATGWRAGLDEGELTALEATAGQTLAQLHRRAIDLSAP
jgi:hypothetical protein